MKQVAIVRSVRDGEVQLLRAAMDHVAEGEVESLLIFGNAETAEHYVKESEGLSLAYGWRAVEVSLGDLVAICAAFGIGYLALPGGPGLGKVLGGPVLDVAQALTDFEF
jgi:hypothetical protein